MQDDIVPPSPEKLVFAALPGKQEMFLSTPADIAIYGGARGGGKSYCLLLESLRNTSNGRFAAVIFRRTFPQIQQEGGLWDTSLQIYPYAGATGSKGQLKWVFPSGSTIRFSHMENPEDRYDWLGASIPFIGFDELCTFGQEQFFFLLGSNRSTCGVKPYVRCTTNPEAKSWVADLISWWWDPETGYPIEERAGKIRYFVRIKNRLEWADTPDELVNQYPGMMPKSLTFIPAKVFDNQVLMKKDPGYLANLLALPLVDRERYLGGNWKIDSAGGIMFKREWFKIIPEAPKDLTRFVRCWDVAATEPKKGRDPDWTAGVLLSVKNGQWFILDVQRFRGTPMVVEQRIKQTAQTDPEGTMIRMEREPGASGIITIDHYARFVLQGYDFLEVPCLRSKPNRASALSSAAESGNVLLVKGAWNATFLDEAENFKGEDEKNDQIDAAAHGQRVLKEATAEWTFALPTGTTRYDALVPLSVGRYQRIGS